MVLSAREVADTVGVIMERLHRLAPLIDQVLVVGGTDSMAQVDLEVRRNRHQPVERPPYATLGARA